MTTISAFVFFHSLNSKYWQKESLSSSRSEKQVTSNKQKFDAKKSQQNLERLPLSSFIGLIQNKPIRFAQLSFLAAPPNRY